MLEQIEIKKFQCHDNSVINLAPGVNIISGSSDHGKTSVFRAIGLVKNNSPSGYRYKPWQAKKKDVTIIGLKFDNGKVERRRSDTIDEYLIQASNCSTDPFKAMNRQVPEQISEFLNLNEYNFQSQHDPHFFISKTPGERAKLLNEVSGLEIIDKSTSKINSLIKENNSLLEKSKEEIKNLGNKKEKIEFVVKADAILTDIEEGVEKENKLTANNNILSNYCQSIEKLQTVIDDNKEFLLIKASFDLIQSLINKNEFLTTANEKIIQYVDKITVLANIIDDKKEFLKIKDLTNKLESDIDNYKASYLDNEKIKKYCLDLKENEDNVTSVKEWLGVKTLYTSSIQYKARYDELEVKQATLLAYIEKALTIDSRAIELDNKVTELKRKKEQYMKKFGICPFCGRGDGDESKL